MVLLSASNASPEEEQEPWQTKVISLADGIRHICANEEFYDVIFNVRGHKFKGHRLILAAMSPKFKNMLLKPDSPSEFHDSSSIIGFQILWRFIYTDELGTTKQNEILEAYRVAKAFEQSQLVEKCEEVIGSMEISVENVSSMLNQVPDIDLLRERCLQFISLNNVDVLNSADFLKATPNTLQDIFRHNCLADVPILTLQSNILRWGCNQFPEMEDYKLVRDLLMNIRVLGKLKIHKLKAEDLAELTIQYPELLTSKEYQKFNVHVFRPDYPLPEWCDLND
ncbi:BTB/POZ domain-containing protein 9 isoform X3 [Parasteatoda tepidariorum]|uniref:BTB/POZ domain-containing protein 9 isoform X2 n=1 Tax=Parasteatoda tepidariorum TaxID=114398 RepID=UPI00077FB497|nr:BTB/POZ domain-containing protein 9 isoform X2 [Parasteatoda tepidariorum]XP_015905648.1 BTB/POZ domain-containing protein 9 isoform X3 [Parasteatoda tepidariorum]